MRYRRQRKFGGYEKYPPIKSLCPLLSESWDLEETKGAVSREGWVEQKEPHGDWAGTGWFGSIGQEE